MRLVDDDVAQVVQHVAPAIVVRQHADVQHVGVREDHVRPLADLPAALERCVAVVDRSADVRGFQLGKRPRLILRKRLGRVEVQRTVLRLTRKGVEHGQVERQALAGRGAGRDDDVLAARRCIPNLSLMDVEAVQPAHGKCIPDARVQVLRQRRGACVCGRDGFDVCDLLAFEQVVPECGPNGHEPDASLGVPGCPARG